MAKAGNGGANGRIRLRRMLLGALVLGGIGVALWVANRPQPLAVDIAQVRKGPMEVTVNADAVTRIRDVYALSAPVSGRLLRSPVEVGDKVVADETVLARLAPGEPAFLDERSLAQAQAAVSQAEAALTLARAQVRVAEVDLSDAQRQLNRLHDLYERGTVPPAQLEQAEAAVDVAAANLDAAHATVAMREAELAAQKAMLIGPRLGRNDPDAPGPRCCLELVAPVSGQVLTIADKSARMVMAGAPILSVGPRHDLEIVADLLSTDAVRIGPGAPAHVERWGGAGVLEARVRVIEPAAFTKVSALGIEEQRVKVIADFTEPPTALPPQLGDGFRVYLRVVEWRGEDEVLVPVSALFRKGQDWAVFVVVTAGEAGAEAGRIARERRVSVGRRNTEVAQVLSGLAPGDEVIKYPSDKIADGVLVTPRQVQ